MREANGKVEQGLETGIDREAQHGLKGFAGGNSLRYRGYAWIPAFAGMTQGVHHEPILSERDHESEI
jgi:hypothetical protein